MRLLTRRTKSLLHTDRCRSVRSDARCQRCLWRYARRSSGAGGEKEIRRAADGDGVQTGVSQVGVESGENLLFIAQVTVGQENDVAQIVWCGRLLHQVKQRGEHLVAAACLQRLNVAARSSQIF